MIGGCTSLAQRMITKGVIGVIYDYVQGAGYQVVLASHPLEPGRGYWIGIFGITDQAELCVEAENPKL